MLGFPIHLGSHGMGERSKRCGARGLWGQMNSCVAAVQLVLVVSRRLLLKDSTLTSGPPTQREVQKEDVVFKTGKLIKSLETCWWGEYCFPVGTENWWWRTSESGGTPSTWGHCFPEGFWKLSQTELLYGCFLKWWYPQNTPKWSFFVGKPMGLLGKPTHFRKPP